MLKRVPALSSKVDSSYGFGLPLLQSFFRNSSRQLFLHGPWDRGFRRALTKFLPSMKKMNDYRSTMIEFLAHFLSFLDNFLGHSDILPELPRLESRNSGQSYFLWLRPLRHIHIWDEGLFLEEKGKWYHEAFIMQTEKHLETNLACHFSFTKNHCYEKRRWSRHPQLWLVPKDPGAIQWKLFVQQDEAKHHNAIVITSVTQNQNRKTLGLWPGRSPEL